jgi:2,3-bisphosphoglycerate-dependent phosphoglycerate mutase
MKLILLRHGESQWNLENRFTGWKDVGLTDLGIEEAKFSGEQILKKNIPIHKLYTSILKRANHTAHIVSDVIDFNKDDIVYDWRLNERHYGALQGLNKSETAAKYGEEQVHIWRRSYDIPPPLLSINDERHPRFNKKFSTINHELPAGESLKTVIERLEPFWINFLKDVAQNQGNRLIVAHSNSLRAIVKMLEKISDKDILSLNIPTGVPLVYDLDNSFNIIDKNYLINKQTLKEKQSIITNQGKIK